MDKKIKIKITTEKLNAVTIVASSFMVAISAVAMFFSFGMMAIVAGLDLAKEQKVIMAFDLGGEAGSSWRSTMFPENWQPIERAGLIDGVNVFYDGDCETCWIDINLNPIRFNTTIRIIERDERGNPIKKEVVDLASGKQVIVENKHPYRFLHDFSYAGYKFGQIIPPLIEPDCRIRAQNSGLITINITDVEVGGKLCRPNGGKEIGGMDCRPHIMDTIKKLGEAGGAIYFPPGEYRITPFNEYYFFKIEKSNVVLCGAGYDKTFIKMDPLWESQSLMKDNGGILVQRYYDTSEPLDPILRYNYWSPIDNTKINISQDIDFPTFDIPVASVSPFHEGDPVIIKGYLSANYLDEHDMAGAYGEVAPWPAQGTAYSYRRTIKEIDQENKIIKIDVPIRYRVKAGDEYDNAYVARTVGGVSGVGLENFSIGIVRHPGAFEDGNAVDDAIGGNDAITFRDVADSWIYKIHTYTPAENFRLDEKEGYELKFLNNVLSMRYGRNITVQDFSFSGCQKNGGSASCYVISLDDCNEVLIQRGDIYQTKKGFIINANGPNSGNVFRYITIRDPIGKTSPLDYHGRLSMSNHIENITLDDGLLEASVRSFNSNDGHGTTQSVFWNITGTVQPTLPINWDGWDPDNDNNWKIDKSDPDYSIVVSNQFGWGYIIGTYGDFPNVITAAMPNRSYNRDNSKWRPLIVPRDFCEGVGCPFPYSPDQDYSGTLEPESLYQAQLDIRMAAGGWPEFKRGDANADSKINLTDSVYLINYLFASGEMPPCFDAADFDDNGVLNITDAIYLLNYLYLGDKPAPLEPFNQCGVDPTMDNIGCTSFLPCEE